MFNINNFKNILSIMTSAFLTVPSYVASAGGITGSGSGEKATVEGGPWFVGAEPIQYCIEIDSDNFSATASEIRDSVKAVFEDWFKTLDLIELRSINPVDFPKLGNRSIARSEAEVDCAQNPEIKFKFGVFDKTVNDALAQHPKLIVGLAELQSFDQYAGRGKGYIWLAADQGEKVFKGSHREKFWSSSDHAILKTVLLHEMGHVFGFNHELTHSIMDANVPVDVVSGKISLLDKMLRSSQNIADLNWFSSMPNKQNQKAFCAKAIGNHSHGERDAILELFNIRASRAAPIFACFTRRASAGDTTYKIELQLEGGTVIRKLEFWQHGAYKQSTNIEGYYWHSEKDTSSNIHTFANLLNRFTIRGRALIDGQLYAAELEGNTTAFSVLIIKDGFFHRFDVSKYFY